MQSRRREEHVTASPASKLRAQQRLEVVPDAYRRTRRDGSDRSPAHQRILSPQKLDGLRRGVGGNKGSNVFERRDYNRGSDTFERKDYNEGSDTFERRGYDYQLGGHRCSHVESRSPPIEQARKRPQIDEGVRHRSCSPPLGLRPRYELPKSMDYSVDDENLVAKCVFGYEHVNCNVNREKEFIEGRLVDGQGMLDHKLMINDDAVQGSYRSLSDTGITSQYEETGGHLPPLSRSGGTVRIEHERLQHRDPLPSDKLANAESSRGGEKLIYHTRDAPYSMTSSSYSKDLASASQLIDYGSSSLGTSRTDSLCSHRDANHLQTSYELLRSSGKLTDTVGFSGYGQRPPMDTFKDPETRKRTITCHQQCAYSPTKHEEYLNFKVQVRAQGEHGYQYDDLPRRIAPHSQLDYEQAPMKYDNREFCRPSMHHVLDTTGRDEDSYATHRRGDLHDHLALQKEKYYDCADKRTLISSKQGDDYLAPGYAHPEIGKRMSQDHEISYLGASEADRLSILRSEYESRRDGGPGLQHERFHISPFSSHNLETQRRTVRMHDIKQGLGIQDHSDATLKRKYNADEHIDVHGSRIMKSSKWNSHEDVYESEEWLDDEEMDVLYSSGNVGFDHNIYRKDKGDYNGLDNQEDYPSDDWLSNQDSLQHPQRRSVKFRTYYCPNVKNHPRFNSSSWYRSQHFSKRSAIPKQSKLWKHHVYDDNMHINNEESSEDWKDAKQSEPSEGSEEFMQMVHEAFLMYSKKLNLNSSVQRRYKDQGKAGSLYCIVCGRSSSKEFMDTRRLVTHAFMSHKAGLRAKHLGLHKAVCVLLGWDTVVPQDTITWFPQVLPNDEALAQKEDLILWPPLVVIHNITMSDDSPQKWKVVSMETIEAFLRGKGFVRGRIKLCLGKPADQSIILVKFLGTFVGLGDAEGLHKYLSANNRGRVEFERIKSKNIRSHEIGESGIHEDNVESILYGYMGIAEDLDKLDFNSKKWSLIKSKKDIEDLENAPIKTSER